MKWNVDKQKHGYNHFADVNYCMSMHIDIGCQISCSCPISFMNLINDLAFAQIQLHRQYQITSVILFSTDN